MKQIPLGDLLESSDSGVWGDEDVHSGISVLRSTNFNSDGTLDLTKPTFRALDTRDQSRKLLRAGDILLEKSGGGPKQPVGRVCLFRGDEVPHAFGNFIARLRPRKAVLSEYLFYYLWQFHRNGQTSYYQKQTTGIRNLEFKRYLTIPVPVCSIEEQRRIVDLLSRAEGIVRLRRQAQQKAAELIPAIFVEMFGDPATNPKGWPLRSVRELVARFESGKNLQAASDGSTKFRILKISAVTSGEYIEIESKPTPDNYEPPHDHIVREGDMLFSRANTEELVGATAVVRATNGRTLLPDKLWRFVWAEPVEQAFMHALFQSAYVRHELGKLSSGTSASMRNISQAKLFELRLPIPPLAQQSAFARHAETLRSIQSQQVLALQKATATFSALLTRTFAAEGVTAALHEAEDAVS